MYVLFNTHYGHLAFLGPFDSPEVAESWIKENSSRPEDWKVRAVYTPKNYDPKIDQT